MKPPRLLALAVTVGIVAAACAGATAPATGGTAAPAPSVPPALAAATPTSAPIGGRSPSPTPATPSAFAAGTPLPAPTPHGDVRVGSGVEFNYTGIKDAIRGFDGVAIIRIVDIGLLQWNTVDGTRPSEAALHTAWSVAPEEPGWADYFIGRPYTVELVRMASGRWIAPIRRTNWWVWGGKIGADETVVSDPAGIAPRLPVKGELAVGVTSTVDFKTGVSEYVQVLFPIDASGRVLTADPSEHVTLDDIDQHLR